MHRLVPHLTILLSVATTSTTAVAAAPERLVAEAIGAARSSAPGNVEWSAVEVVCPSSSFACHIETVQPDNRTIAALLSSLDAACETLHRSDCSPQLVSIETTESAKWARIDFLRPALSEDLPSSTATPRAGPHSSEPVVRGVLATVRAHVPPTIDDDFDVLCTADHCIIRTVQQGNQQVAEALQALEQACAALDEAPCSVWLQDIEAIGRNAEKAATIEVREGS